MVKRPDLIDELVFEWWPPTALEKRARLLLLREVGGNSTWKTVLHLGASDPEQTWPSAAERAKLDPFISEYRLWVLTDIRGCGHVTRDVIVAQLKERLGLEAAPPTLELGEKLSPTEELVCELLAARWRLGESLWTFDTSTLPTARRLRASGLITTMHGIVEHTYRASLTEAGRARFIDSSYQAPLFREVHELTRYSTELDRPDSDRWWRKGWNAALQEVEDTLSRKKAAR